MSSIWVDKENAPDLQASNGLKILLSARKHSAKKQAFGELKNIINAKQNSTTPFNGLVKPDSFGGSSKSLCKDVLKKQQFKQNFNDAQQMLEKQLKPKEVFVTKSTQIEIFNDRSGYFGTPFDLMDFPNLCSNEKSKKIETAVVAIGYKSIEVNNISDRRVYKMLTILFLTSRFLSKMPQVLLRPLVICGPSGSGKSTLLKKLFEEFPNTFGFSVSHTTRKPRPGENNGIHYFFVTPEQMKEAIAKDEFIETAVFGGNTYGTSKTAIRSIQNTGKVCILDIEPQGVEQIKKTNLNPILIYNNPPSIKELENRLRKRNTETEESLQKRLDSAATEISYGLTSGNFHKVINNEDIETAYAEFRDFIIKQLKAQEENGVFINW